MSRVDLAEPETSSSDSGAVPPIRTTVALDEPGGDGGRARVPRMQSTGRSSMWPFIGLLLAWLIDLLLQRL